MSRERGRERDDVKSTLAFKPLPATHLLIHLLQVYDPAAPSSRHGGCPSHLDRQLDSHFCRTATSEQGESLVVVGCSDTKPLKAISFEAVQRRVESDARGQAALRS